MENTPDARKLADFIGEALTNNTQPNPSTLSNLAAKINELINKDYARLVALLYEIDIDEEKLKLLLLDNKITDVGHIIAALIIERQSAKVETRQQYKRNEEIDENEKW